MFEYAARVERVVDGDTLVVMIDLGFHVFTRTRVRLANVYVAEGASSAASYLRCLVEGKDVVIVTRRDRSDLYGRYVAVVTCGGVDVNASMRAKFPRAGRGARSTHPLAR